MISTVYSLQETQHVCNLKYTGCEWDTKSGAKRGEKCHQVDEIFQPIGVTFNLCEEKEGKNGVTWFLISADQLIKWKREER